MGCICIRKGARDQASPEDARDQAAPEGAAGLVVLYYITLRN